MKLAALILGLVAALGAAFAQQEHGAAAPAKPQPAAPAQHAPAAAQQPAAQEPAHEAAGQEAAGEHPTVAEAEHGASAIFMTLFKHLEPHAVFAVWFGGSAGGMKLVKPYEADAAGKPLHVDEHEHPVTFHDRAELLAHYGPIFGGGTGYIIWNITTVQWIAAAIVLLVFVLLAARARQLSAGTPRGTLFHILESTVLYVRDEMVYAVMGKEAGQKFVPLFLTQFFFILTMNILGLVPAFGPFLGTATANLAVTGGMALTTLIWIHASGIRKHGFFHHWQNFVPHGLPAFVMPIIIPVEILGMLVKPAALTVRLFANMTAGHLVMLSLFGLAYVSGSVLLGSLPLAMAVAINCLELFVAFVQAYIFTYLSIVFIGASVNPEH
jgi:F-type H+-transporting ATPase subunit a